MACSTASVPLQVMTVWFLLHIKTGHGLKRSGTCRSVCFESDCITANQDRLDFTAAADACSNQNGELLSFQSEAGLSIFDFLSPQLVGNFWIGLRLPAGVCSNLSVPLRGYEWTSGNTDRRFSPSLSWTKSTKLCSAHCVSVSNDGKWTERPCSERTEGFLCKAKHKNGCKPQASSEPVLFLGSKGCSAGPCEHMCKSVKGGYTCSCFSGYVPDSKEPHRCSRHCAKQACPALCEGGIDSACYCPHGFLLSNKAVCEDINECEMGECHQDCKNTYGSFVCSCKKGYTLKDEVKCIKSKNAEESVTTPVVEEVVKPSTDSGNATMGSSVSKGGFVWLWIVVAVAVLVCIFVIRFHVVNRQKRREQNLNQQSAALAPVDQTEG